MLASCSLPTGPAQLLDPVRCCAPRDSRKAGWPQVLPGVPSSPCGIYLPGWGQDFKTQSLISHPVGEPGASPSPDSSKLATSGVPRGASRALG